jgi:hypothetical protein
LRQRIHDGFGFSHKARGKIVNAFGASEAALSQNWTEGKGTAER